MEKSIKGGKDIGLGEALGMVWDVLIPLLVSTLLFAFGGRWLDKTYGTGWVFTALGFVLVMLFGYRIIKIKGASIVKRLEDTGPSKKTDISP